MIYIDCEFDGHNGPLLSMALVGDVQAYITTPHKATDLWVIENVEPHLDVRPAHIPFYNTRTVGAVLRDLVPSGAVIIADSPVDIYRFCREFSTSGNEWVNTGHAELNFKVLNIDYPHVGIKHHAYWDAYSMWLSQNPHFNCRNYLQKSGQPHPRSGCKICGGVFHACHFGY